MPSDLAAVIAIMRAEPLCVECLVRKTNVPPARLDAILSVLRRAFVARAFPTCARCLRSDIAVQWLGASD